MMTESAVGVFSQQDFNEVKKYLTDLRGQDDRSRVIMIAARLESLLKQAIEERLLEGRSNNRDSFGYLSFAKCVSLCLRLGLIHREHADALDELRKIRNRAAHFDKPFALTDDECQQPIKSFSAPWRTGVRKSHFHKFYQAARTTSTVTERDMFDVTASIFLVLYSTLMSCNQRLSRLGVVRVVHGLYRE